MRLGSVISSALYQGSDTQGKGRLSKVIYLVTTLKQGITRTDHIISFLLCNKQPPHSKLFAKLGVHIFSRKKINTIA